MDDGDQPRTFPGAAMLAGLEAGMAAVLVMLGWLALASAWNRHSVWTTARLMASGFYGEAAFHPGFTRSCLAGIAVYLVLYSALGALFALLAGGYLRHLRPVLGGMIWGLVWYYLLFGIAWKRWNPLIALYTHDSPMLMGHVLYGALLSRYRGYLRNLLPPARTGHTEPKVLEQ